MNLIKRTLFGCFLLALIACNNFKATDAGVKYKIISKSSGAVVSVGEVLKMHMRQMYGDSVLRDTRKFIPEYQVLDSSVMSKDAFEIFRQVKAGDSIVFLVQPDSTLKKKFSKLKGNELMTMVKIIAILANQDSAKNDQESERKRLMP
ncbi:hypothetical protein [Pedobacter nyackensis]|uniref:Lipoprotein n=1 Tax=Pedobacter nyackensis TaxID=475255 RepID=A0A1W2F5L6_9SPHI|nr:hypothetical protein [Pedobacter nyackensis]SMD17221.1 hypothetical protein SAMN04488101_12224 [Pedobacter nyackensis]